MLLILQSEYTAHQSTLSAITSNHEQIEINTNDCIYCAVTNQTAFNSYKWNLNNDNYSDGILLPPGALGR
jgi:hypothetical protein